MKIINNLIHKIKNFKKEQKNNILIIYIFVLVFSFILVAFTSKDLSWIDFSLFFLVLLNVFLFIKIFNIKNLLISLFRVLVISFYKIFEFNILKNEIIDKDFIGIEEFPLDLTSLHNYIVNIANNSEFYQIILLLLPGFLYIDYNLHQFISCFGVQGSDLLKTAAKYPQVVPSNLEVVPIKIAYERNYISRSSFNKMLQENKSLSNLLKYQPEYAQNAMLNPFIQSYFKDLEHANAENSAGSFS